MLKTKVWILIAIGFVPYVSFGQKEGKTQKFHYFNQNLSGPIIGEDLTQSSFNAMMLHGVRYGKFTVAPGLSYDKYFNLRSIHAVGSASFDLCRMSPATLFFQGLGGIGTFKNLSEDETGLMADNKRGRIYQASLGLRLPTGNWRIYLMAGYRIQQFSYRNSASWFIDFRENSPFTSEVELDFRRVVVQLGFGIR
jgi:hypothetical protein